MRTRSRMLLVALTGLCIQIGAATAGNCGSTSYDCNGQPIGDSQTGFAHQLNGSRQAYRVVQDSEMETRWQTSYKTVTETEMRSVQRTHYRTEHRTVMKNCTEIQNQEQLVKVCKPVCETVMKECQYKVCKRVPVTCYKDVCTARGLQAGLP
jgi:hypothetical protein